MLGIIMSIFSGIISPLVKAWTNYQVSQLKTNEAGFAAGAAADVAITQAMLTAEVQNNALKVSVYGQPITRVCMWVAGFPACLHFGLIFVDTILASKYLFGHAVLGIPTPPKPFDLYEWAVVSSFFLVQAVHLGASNVSQWFAKK